MLGVIKHSALCFAITCLLGAQQPPQDPEQTPAGRKSYLGREVAQTMHWTGASWLMRQTREQEENGALLLKWLAIQPGEMVCDFGCGSGYHTLPIAKAVAATGKVFAVDLQPQMLTLLKKRTDRNGLSNVAFIEATIDDPNLAAASCDLILLVDVYHELSHPVTVMQRLRAALRADGRIVLVEFRAEDPNVPIKPEHMMSKAQVIREMASHGLALAEQFDELPWQHAMSFKRSAESGPHFEARQLLQSFLKTTRDTGQREAYPFLADGFPRDQLPKFPDGLRAELRNASDERIIADLESTSDEQLTDTRSQIVIREDYTGRWYIDSIRDPQRLQYAHGSPRPFVAMHNALGTDDIDRRIARAKKYGFDGVAWSLEELAKVRRACDAQRLDLWSAYATIDLSRKDGAMLLPAKEAIKNLSGGPGMLWLAVQNTKLATGDKAGDERATKALTELLSVADIAGVEIALYPHHGFWIQTMDDALRVSQSIRHPRLGVVFNLCHFLRNQETADPTAALKRAGSKLFAVTINGADSSSNNWQGLIQPLGAGDFDIKALLQTLDELQFLGPIGLQCYGINSPPSEHLPQSMQAWQQAIQR